jgi:hypothetical protein
MILEEKKAFFPVPIFKLQNASPIILDSGIFFSEKISKDVIWNWTDSKVDS